MNTKPHSAPAFQVYPTEELSDLLGLPAYTRGVFTTLRSRHWLGRSLPTSRRELVRLAAVPAAEFARAWLEIRHLFERRGARYVLPKLEQLRREYDAHHAERSASGEDGAAKRWFRHIPKKIPKQANRRFAVLVRLAHDTILDGKLLQKLRGLPTSEARDEMQKHFAARARGISGLVLDIDNQRELLAQAFRVAVQQQQKAHVLQIDHYRKAKAK